MVASDTMSAGEDLQEFRWHTGAEPRPLDPESPTPVLFRDLGPAAMERWLTGALPRLAGPPSPVTWLRTERYAEPYTDHLGVGRLVLLPTVPWRPWYSGVDECYVTLAERSPYAPGVGLAPPSVDEPGLVREARGMRSVAELEEHLGATARAWREGLLPRLRDFARDLAETELRAAPLRRMMQCRVEALRERARRSMEALGLTEGDLCTAWHHLSEVRREHLREALKALPKDVIEAGWEAPL
ncbi:MAG: hypothetical protein HY909_11150 [Deltaproteobacteria bacterium]|nr:hypothetical protein [Deltaproteobacteria bacterium]